MDYVREVYEHEGMLLEAVPVVGCEMFVRAQPNWLPQHAHLHAYEITYITRGWVDWWVGDQVFRVGAGQVFITRPSEQHGGVDTMMHPNELCYLHVNFPKTTPLPGLAAEESHALRQAFEQMPFRTFTGSRRIRDLINRILLEHRRPTDFSPLVVRAALHDLLVSVIRDCERYASQPGVRPMGRSEQIQQAIDYIEHNLAEIETIEEIIARINLSASQFRRLFQQETGLTPNQYLTHLRVRRAKTLLARPRASITEAAHALGFSSSQYFATVFKRYTGLTPRQFRDQAHTASPLSQPDMV